MPAIVKVPDYLEDALQLLISFFEDAEGLQKLLGVLLVELDELEDVFYDLDAMCRLDTAEGVQLDQWGRIVGQPRLAGWTDDRYRLAIETRIQINLGRGEAWRVIRIVSILMDGASVWYRQIDRAAYRLEWYVDSPTPADWVQFLRDTLLELTPAGVWFEAVEAPTVDRFRFDVGPGLDTGKMGRIVI